MKELTDPLDRHMVYFLRHLQMDKDILRYTLIQYFTETRHVEQSELVEFKYNDEWYNEKDISKISFYRKWIEDEDIPRYNVFTLIDFIPELVRQSSGWRTGTAVWGRKKWREAYEKWVNQDLWIYIFPQD